jgi:hypothetical protein
MDGLVGLLAIFLLIAIGFNLLSPSKNTINWRLTRLEQKVDLLMQQLNIEYVDPSSETIRRYLMQGKKLEAIRAFRELNPGTSLQEAKTVVESIAQTIHQS